MGEFIVSSELIGVQDVGRQAAYTSARLGLQLHHPDQVVRRRGGFGAKICPHHSEDERWDVTPHGCQARLRDLKMILSLTVGRAALRDVLVEQGLITRTEADKGIQAVTQGRKRISRHRQRRQSRPSPRPTPATPRAIGVAQVVAR